MWKPHQLGCTPRCILHFGRRILRQQMQASNDNCRETLCNWFRAQCHSRAGMRIRLVQGGSVKLITELLMRWPNTKHRYRQLHVILQVVAKKAIARSEKLCDSMATKSPINLLFDFQVIAMHTEKRPVSTHQNNCKILTKAKQHKVKKNQKKIKTKRSAEITVAAKILQQKQQTTGSSSSSNGKTIKKNVTAPPLPSHSPAPSTLLHPHPSPPRTLPFLCRHCCRL